MFPCVSFLPLILIKELRLFKFVWPLICYRCVCRLKPGKQTHAVQPPTVLMKRQLCPPGLGLIHIAGRMLVLSVTPHRSVHTSITAQLIQGILLMFSSQWNQIRSNLTWRRYFIYLLLQTLLKQTLSISAYVVYV